MAEINLPPGLAIFGVNPPSTRRAPEGGSPLVRDGPNFERILNRTLLSGELEFSAHARERISGRGIDLNPETLRRLESAVSRVAEKGGRMSLVLMDSAAFVVSVDKGRVITAMGRESLDDAVFTQIDSAVIAR